MMEKIEAAHMGRFCYTYSMQQTFADKVRAIVAKIPKGKTMTYKQVAAKAGNPNAARAVGQVMRKNYDLGIPCHRVIRSDGIVGEYNRGGREEKLRKLRAEGAIPQSGHQTLARGRKYMARYGKKAQAKVEKVMHEYKEGTLKSGRSGAKVKSRKQAIAIGLSEARRAGVKVPKKKASRAR